MIYAKHGCYKHLFVETKIQPFPCFLTMQLTGFHQQIQTQKSGGGRLFACPQVYQSSDYQNLHFPDLSRASTIDMDTGYCVLSYSGMLVDIYCVKNHHNKCKSIVHVSMIHSTASQEKKQLSEMPHVPTF